jgi:hypothetical protein
VLQIPIPFHEVLQHLVNLYSKTGTRTAFRIGFAGTSNTSFGFVAKFLEEVTQAKYKPVNLSVNVSYAWSPNSSPMKCDLWLRFYLSVLGVDTGLSVLDERYLFAGVPFLFIW